MSERAEQAADVRSGSERVARGASPVAAAALAAGIVYCWAEAIFRYAFTHSASFNNEFFFLFSGRPGDVASLWFTITMLELFVFGVLVFSWRRRERVGTLRDWTIVLIFSAIAAPMLGEIGTPGTGTIGAGTTDTIAWVVFGIALIASAAALAWPRLGSRKLK